MVRLRQRDFRAILDFMRGAYATDSLQQYARHVTTSLGHLIGANYVSYNEVDLRDGHNRPVVDPPEAVVFSGYTDGIFERHLREHPIVDHFVRTGDLAAAKISDFVSRRQFHGLGIYQEFFRHVRTEYQLAAGVAAGRSHLIDIGLSRTRPDFSERDRLVLDIVRGHLADAYENVRQLSGAAGDLALVLQGTDGVDAGVAVLRPDGRIGLASPLARRLMAEYFGADGAASAGIPDALGRWVRHEAQRLASDDALSDRAKPLVVERDGRRLVVRLLVGSDRTVIVLTEERLDLDPCDLEALGLSQREAEVLAWVAKGKTDTEVATIIGTRPRTVSKHLERIYQKLGVENRTAAATRAFETAPRRG